VLSGECRHGEAIKKLRARRAARLARKPKGGVTGWYLGMFLNVCHELTS
jgi:hypothetical protein